MALQGFHFGETSETATLRQEKLGPSCYGILTEKENSGCCTCEGLLLVGIPPETAAGAKAKGRNGDELTNGDARRGNDKDNELCF